VGEVFVREDINFTPKALFHSPNFGEGIVVNYSIKWSRAVKKDLTNGKKYIYQKTNYIDCFYRPFVKSKLYFCKELNEMQNLMARFFRGDNQAILVSGPNSPKPFTCFVTSLVPDFNSLSPAADGCRVMPLFDYTHDGEKVDNIPDLVLMKFRKKYSSPQKKYNQPKLISKLDIFHYNYAVLHHPAYRHKYEINLKREFPRIPFYPDFWKWAGWGERLMHLHLNYEIIEPFPLERVDRSVPETFKVTPRLMARKDQGLIEVDTVTTLRGVPPEAWDYRLGTYTALEWILERYKEKTPKDPTIREKFNTYKFADYKEQVIDLLLRVCTVSVETMKIIFEMPEPSD
jgi:predicted helicase